MTETTLSLQSSIYAHSAVLNSLVSLWKGDITTLEIDAIVNAANDSLLGGGGIDGAIHKKAGPKLKEECSKLKGCKEGCAKLTLGYKLPSKYIIHTVGPNLSNRALNNSDEVTLRNCYLNSLSVGLKNKIKSIAFCCISTGIYNFPNDKAAHIALSTVREWLEDNYENVSRIVFCVYTDEDFSIYQNLMVKYFPTK